MSVQFGYNLGAMVVSLFEKFHGMQIQKQQNTGKEVNVWNRYLALIAELKGHITKALAAGDKVVSLVQHSDITSKISSIAKDLGRPENLLLLNAAGALGSPETAKSQLDLLDQEGQYGGQEINLKLTRMTQSEKEVSEIHKTCSNVLEEQNQLLKKIGNKI